METVIWVSPDVDVWRVQREGPYRPEAECRARDEAIVFARRAALSLAPAVVKVQDYSGVVVQEFVFGAISVSAAE